MFWLIFSWIKNQKVNAHDSRYIWDAGWSLSMSDSFPCSHLFIACSSTHYTSCNFTFGVTVHVFWKWLPLTFCIVFFFLIRHPSNFCYRVFSNLFIISGTKLHYQTKVDQTLISNPFKPLEKLFQHRGTFPTDPDLQNQRSGHDRL